nr:transcription factor bHLH167-like [Ipomoea batatas]GMD70125.1 transcription factor bHLH167-like [Ipomoea batatas]
METNLSFPRPKAGRHLAEKQRRQKLKGLSDQLASIVVISGENCPEKKKSSGLNLLDQATNYIKQLEKNISELKARMDSLQVPVEIAVKESETLLEINIVCGSENKKLKMHKVIRILEEEGAEVVSASFSTVDLKIYHTILCKAFLPRLGMDTIMVQRRLKSFISGTG